LVGALILNRFQIERKLGSGGFGTVYRAWDPRLERHVAVKVIEAGEETGQRIMREAQAAARLNHPGIVTLYELGEEHGSAYLVSELVEGETLRRLSLDGDLSDRDVAEVGADLCEALDHAHSRGVVHRDIKPQNVLVCDGEPHAKLMDFGIARVVDAAGLTATGSVLGTLAYMAPEQAEGIEAGPEADVYSLGLTLYECWSGENPHLRATPAATARSIGTPTPSLRRHRPDLPHDLIEVVDACLDPDTEMRPTLEQLGETIEDSLGDLDQGAAVPHPHAATAPGRLAERLGGCQAPDVAAAAAVGGLVAAAVIAVDPQAPAAGLALPPVAALLTLLRPRLGYLSATLGLAAWLAFALGRPGSALVLTVLTLPPALALSGDGRALVLPAAAPALGAVGLAPAFPAIAALGRRWRDRVVLAVTGFAWLAATEVVLSRDLLLGASFEPARGWQESAGTAVTGVLVPLVTDARFFAVLAAWVLAALVGGVLLAPLRRRLAREERPSHGSRPARPAAAAGVGGSGGRRAALS
jgi:hypothetical protein